MYMGLVSFVMRSEERWGAGVETQKNVRGEVGGWGRVPFNVVRYHLRRGVGLIKFLKMVLDPSPPPLVLRRSRYFVCDSK